MNKKNILIYFLFVLVLSICFAVGYLSGSAKIFHNVKGYSKIDTILDLVGRYYIDSVDIEKIQIPAIESMLSNLDPYSAYISPEVKAELSKTLEGSYSGIGLVFLKTGSDTLVVSDVYPASPSDRAGVLEGDRLLSVDGKNVLGKSIEEVSSAIKGKEKTVVKLSLLRGTSIVEASIVRGEVAVSTIVSNYLISDSILYCQIKEWGATTYKEFIDIYGKNKSKVRSFIIDLRGNPGGLLTSAIDISSEFLDEDLPLLSIKGQNYKEESILSNGNPLFLNMPLVVLIDENSASASEIFSGIMQDYDRATIIGRQSFGKGLVQEPFQLADGGELRLAVASYYTPSGRSIQKKYKKDIFSYNNYPNNNYKIDSIPFYTLAGRVVYGGAGISPDLFVPKDSTKLGSYYLELLSTNMIERFALDYVNENRSVFYSLSNIDAIESHLDVSDIIGNFVSYCIKNGIQSKTYLMYRNWERIKSEIYFLIIKHTLGYNQANIYNNRSDHMLYEAVSLIEGASSNPIDLMLYERN